MEWQKEKRRYFEAQGKQAGALQITWAADCANRLNCRLRTSLLRGGFGLDGVIR